MLSREKPTDGCVCVWFTPTANANGYYYFNQDVLQVIKAPKMVFQKGHVVAINKPCAYLPPMLPTASSKICLLEAPTKAMINPGGDGEEEVVNRIKKMLRPMDGREDEEHYLKYDIN